jgi:hypothetical protein
MLVEDIFKTTNKELLYNINLITTEKNTPLKYDIVNNLFSPKTLNILNTEPNKNLIEDVVNVSLLKNDVIGMIDLYPDHELELALLDFTIEDKEEQIFETLSTPDFKLYYPEPYVASPSFNHEEI